MSTDTKPDRELMKLSAEYVQACNHEPGTYKVTPQESFGKLEAYVQERETAARTLGFTTEVQSIFAECMDEDLGTYDEKMFAEKVLDRCEELSHKTNGGEDE